MSLSEGKVDLLIERNLGHHPGYRCDRLDGGYGVANCLICPEGTADRPEIQSLRAWLCGAGATGRAARLPPVVARGI
jgi:LysR family glycine cleavage system transcriptional activator